MPCKICAEKDKMIQLEKNRINDILAGYKKDKNNWIREETGYNKKLKVLAIACAVLTAELILVLAQGKDGVMIGIELVKGFFIK